MPAATGTRKPADPRREGSQLHGGPPSQRPGPGCPWSQVRGCRLCLGGRGADTGRVPPSSCSRCWWRGSPPPQPLRQPQRPLGRNWSCWWAAWSISRSWSASWRSSRCFAPAAGAGHRRRRPARPGVRPGLQNPQNWISGVFLLLKADSGSAKRSPSGACRAPLRQCACGSRSSAPPTPSVSWFPTSRSTPAPSSMPAAILPASFRLSPGWTEARTGRCPARRIAGHARHRRARPTRRWRSPWCPTWNMAPPWRCATGSAPTRPARAVQRLMAPAVTGNRGVNRFAHRPRAGGIQPRRSGSTGAHGRRPGRQAPLSAGREDPAIVRSAKGLIG